MKKMNKIISLVVALSIFISIGANALFEANKTTFSLTETYETETGTFYSCVSKSGGKIWNSIVFVPKDSRSVTFHTRAYDEEIIYELELQPNARGLNESVSSLIQEYVEDGIDNLAFAKSINTSKYVLESNTSQTRDSVVADLKNDLRNRHEDEYTRTIRTYTSSTYPGVNSIQIKEDLVFHIYEDRHFGFSAGTSLSAIALTLSGEASVLVSLVATALAIIGETAEVYKSVDTYDAVADYQRFATVNGGSYPYSYANRYTTHRAVNERNNEVRAYIIDLGWTTYSPDANYYGNIDAIADDAYEAFLY